MPRVYLRRKKQFADTDRGWIRKKF